MRQLNSASGNYDKDDDLVIRQNWCRLGWQALHPQQDQMDNSRK